MPGNAFKVAMVANLRAHKGLHVLIAATHYFPAGAPIHILLVGPKPDDPAVLELVGKAYVGSGVLGSSVAMDKAMTKVVLEGAGIPGVDWMLVQRHDWEREPDRFRRSPVDHMPRLIGGPRPVRDTPA